MLGKLMLKSSASYLECIENKNASPGGVTYDFYTILVSPARFSCQYFHACIPGHVYRHE